MKNISTPILLATSLVAVFGLSALAARHFGQVAATPEPVEASEMMDVVDAEIPQQAEQVQRAVRQSAAKPAMQDVQIIDSAGFGQPMVSATTQIPAGWVTQGGVGWDRSSDCVSNHLRFKWLAASPDGEQAFEAMPGYNWQVQGTEIQMNPCPAMPVRSTREFLQMVGQNYPNAQMLEYRDRPDLLPQSPKQYVEGITARSEAGQLVIGYQANGQEMRALLTTTITFTEMQGNVVGGSTAVYAQRAPKGRLNGQIGEHIIKSLKIDTQWLAIAQQTTNAAVERVSQRQRQGIATWHASQMAKINARGEMDRSNIRMQANREVAQIYSNTWANTQRTNDEIHRRNLEGIGSYNTYADPNGGGTVRESIDYNRVLRTESGSYISTNDPNFNPAGAEELQRIP